MPNVARVARITRLTLTYLVIGYFLLTLAGLFGLHNWYYFFNDIAVIVFISIIVIASVLVNIENKYKDNNKG